MAILEPTLLTVNGRRIMLRSARPDDAAALLDLARDAYSTSDYLGAGPDELDPDPAPERIKLAELEANPTWLALIALEDDRPVARLNFRGQAKLRMAHHGQLGMYVRSDRRGRGLGRAVLSACLDWAAAHPTLETVCLGVMTPNLPALRLYESMGFRREEWRIRQFRLGPGRYVDDLKMYRPVKPETGATDPASPEPVDLHAPPAQTPRAWKSAGPLDESRRARLRDGSPVAIRRAREDDAAWLVELGDHVLSTSHYNASTVEEFRRTYTVDREREWIREMRDGPGNLALVADWAGQLIGGLSFRAETRARMAHWGYFSVGIAESWRGRGVGRLLIEALLDWGAHHPTVEKVCLGVLAPNERARKLYRALGFAAEGVRTRGIRYGPGRYADSIEMYQFVKPLD